MAETTFVTSRVPIGNRKSIIIKVFIGACLISLLVSLIVRMVTEFTHPVLTARLTIEQDIPLPGAFPDAYRTSQNPLAPGVAVLFDHFDFMSLDTQTHLLFIAHSGPATDREQQVNPQFNPTTDAKYDGNVVVFNTVQKKVVGLLNIPQVAGIVVAQDLHKVYAADANDNIIYAIDEKTLRYSQITLQDNDSPDGVAYDQPDHLILVSDPGTPPTPDSNIIERKNQNETIINALTDKVVARISLGVDGQWGDDVGHVRYDPGLHRAFVAVQQLTDPNSPNPNLLPPPGTAWLVEFDPVKHQIVTRMKLPATCITPHGMTIDTSLHLAFIACVDEDPSSLIRVDLQTMKPIAESPWPVPLKPDLVVLDNALHLVFVACGAGIAIFQEQGRAFKWLGSYNFGVNTHTIAINEQTQEIYLPLIKEGGRPVLRILRYNASIGNE
ncbi:MAG: YncE family protein [Ktedonobacteraceae bacterium]